ncbi:MAG: response regulator [Clostridia bacterium]|nr:response regulator [Clostridia bacterium]
MTRVVFIEDRTLMLEALKNTVDWLKNDIEPLAFFSSCDEGLPFIVREKPDVVVTDIVMHGMDGLELSQYLHDSDLDIKVIIVSAYSHFEYAQRALQMGVYDYFEKPLDFEALVQSIKSAGQVTSHARQTREYILNHMEFYRERFFTKLMLGQLGGAEAIRREADFLRLDDYGGVVCVCVKLIDAGRAAKPDKAMDREMAYLLLGRHMAQKLGDNPLFGPFSLHDEEAIYVLTRIREDMYEDVETALIEATQTLFSSGRVIVHSGVGAWQSDISKLSLSYDSACRALDACFSFDENCVINAGDLNLTDSAPWLLMNRFEAQLIRSIDMQDMVALHDAIDRFRQQIGRAYPQSGTMKVMMKSLAFKVESMQISSHREIDAVLSRIEYANNMDEMLEILAGYCEEVCGALRNDRNRQSRQLTEQVRAYIDDNFDRDTLCLNDIARHVSVSSNYLSSIFKRELGTGIHDYITTLRINRAKELLIRTDMSIGIIGTKTGYPNPYHFSMNFKKYTDMTPTEFRKKNQA